MSRILIWSPNYAPELTGIAALVTDAAEWLVLRGHELEVVAPVPNYPERRIHPDYRGVLWRRERRGRVDLVRSWLRVRPGEEFLDKVLYELSYATASFPPIVRRAASVDALVCVVPSLLASLYGSLLVRSLGAARPRYVVWMQDLVLSAATVVRGVGSRQRHVLSAVRPFERFAVEGADCTVVCSPGFSDYLADLGVDPTRIATIYNGVDTDEIRPLPPPSGERLRLLYLGNLGYTQDFESLISAAAALNGRADLLIHGEGNAVADVRRLARVARNVRVEKPVPRARLQTLLGSADVDVLVQRRGIAVANLPSKLGIYLASGRPVVAAVDPESSAARLLRDSGGALLVPPENPRELEEALRRLADDPSLRAELGRRGRAFAERRLGREATLGRLEEAILG